MSATKLDDDDVGLQHHPVLVSFSEDDETTHEEEFLLNNNDKNHDHVIVGEGCNGSVMKTPAEKVRFILGGDVGPDTDKGDIHLTCHTLFTQMDVLVHCSDGKLGWKEMARWLKYEETLEMGGRWSKPHVPMSSMRALLQLRRAVSDGNCAMGLGVRSSKGCGMFDVAEAVTETIQRDYHLDDETCRRITEILVAPHKHKDRRIQKDGSDHFKTNGGIPAVSTVTTMSSVEGCPEEVKGKRDPAKRNKLLRRRSGTSDKDLTALYFSYPEGVSPENLSPYKPNKQLKKKLPEGSEAANILVGQVDFLKTPVMAFCRLDYTSIMADLTEVAIPTRFVFLLLSPSSAVNSSLCELSEVGKVFATLINDKVFCEVAYKARTSQDILDGIDEFMDELQVLPPSIWDPETRLEPPTKTMSMDKIQHRLDTSTNKVAHQVALPEEEGSIDDEALKRTGRFFGGLIQDVKSRYPQYLSDFKDGLHVQSIASVIFLYFACIAPIVTFGGLLGHKTMGYMGTMETLLSGAICGILYALLAGQPLTLVGATGPLLVFEAILCTTCLDNGLDFLTFRFWVGIWVCVALLFIVAFDLSAMVRYITRFTEECFAVLVSFIFVYEAFDKIAHIWHDTPVHVDVIREPDNFFCHCLPVPTVISSTPDGYNDSSEYSTSSNYSIWNAFQNTSSSDAAVHVLFPNWTDEFPEDCITHLGRIMVKQMCISEVTCLDRGWNLTGPACFVESVTHSIPDVFFVSFILFFATFAVAMFFRWLPTSRFFPTFVRKMLGDFAVPLAIAICTGADVILGLPTLKLKVPSEFIPTKSDRSWVVNPVNLAHWWIIPLSILPAFLATILIFLDQQITAVIVNRKEHKLKKGVGYHLDLLVLILLIFICSMLGLPWFVAATVQAISHVQSLQVQSDVKIPGERPQIIGVREQRLTGLVIHILIGLSTLATTVLQLIPMSVLYGVFLYMGITSLRGVQFIQRLLIIMMPSKYQPDYIFLRHVSILRVHCFTAIQFACMVTMWIIKSTKTTSLAFPLMLVALIAVRKILDYTFTQSDLFWLDHLLPDEHRREKEDAKNTVQSNDVIKSDLEKTFVDV